MITRYLNALFSWLFIFVFLGEAYGGEPYITHPPKGWECINDPSQLPQKVKVIFIGSGTTKNPFTPSLNIACEETLLPTHEYLNLAKSYHEGQGKTHCALLGKLKTDAGGAELLQIDRASQWGDVRFIQAVLVQEGCAYVVTATCLKNDFSMLSSQIFKAIQSLRIKD